MPAVNSLSASVFHCFSLSVKLSPCFFAYLLLPSVLLSVSLVLIGLQYQIIVSMTAVESTAFAYVLLQSLQLPKASINLPYTTLK